MTQEQLAEAIGYSTNHISKLELARSNPSFNIIIKIADALNVDMKEMFDFDEYRPDSQIEQINEKLKANPERIRDIFDITNVLTTKSDGV